MVLFLTWVKIKTDLDIRSMWQSECEVLKLVVWTVWKSGYCEYCSWAWTALELELQFPVQPSLAPAWRRLLPQGSLTSRFLLEVSKSLPRKKRLMRNNRQTRTDGKVLPMMFQTTSKTSQEGRVWLIPSSKLHRILELTMQSWALMSTLALDLNSEWHIQK